ncbi:M56 family metallopeptidase [Chitinophagaceae bacterium LWZ2-11]
MKIIPNHLINAICDTLILSLWTGVLLAAVAGLTVLCTKRSSARFRYNLLITELGIFAVTVLFIFLKQLFTNETNLGLVATQPAGLVVSSLTQPQHLSASSYLDINGLMRAHANNIVLIWLLIVFIKTLHLFIGLQNLYFLRRKQIFPINVGWEERVKTLATRLGIKHVVNVAESGIAKVPMVIGHLKPLILIPVGLITALPAYEIEAILVHELAHIRRGDYLLNLLVNALEIVFFFNPAVLWLAALIKTERENCCDDVALSYTNNKTDYIKALVACQEYRLAMPAYAMAFSGKKDHLLGRVKRILSNRNSSLNTIERSILAFGLLTAVLLTAAFSKADKINKLVTKITRTTTTVTTVSQKTTTGRDSNQIQTGAKLLKKTEPATIKDTDAKSNADKFKIYSPEQVGEHTDVSFDNGGLQTRLIKISGTLYQFNKHLDQLVSLQVNGNAVPSSDYTHYIGLTANIGNRMEPVVQVAPQVHPISPIKEPIAPIKTLSTPVKEPASPTAQINSYSRNSYVAEAEAYHDGTNLEKLTAKLIAGNIIKKPAELLSFKLSDTEFIVNGQKMPDDIYLKFKKAFVKSGTPGRQEGWSWLYNYDETDQ